MPHLVHERLHLAKAKQCRLVAHRSREIAHHLYQRPHVTVSLAMLSSELGHPCTATFAGTRVHVQIEQPHPSLAVGHLVHLGLGVIALYVGGLDKRQSIESMIEVEDALPYLFKREIGTQQLAVEVVFLFPQQLAVVGEVVFLYRKISTLPPSIVLHLLQIGLRRWKRRLLQPLHESPHRRHIASHLVAKDIRRIIVVTQQPSHLEPQLHNTEDGGVVIIVVASVATIVVGLVEHPTQWTTLGIGHKGNITGTM